MTSHTKRSDGSRPKRKASKGAAKPRQRVGKLTEPQCPFCGTPTFYVKRTGALKGLTNMPYCPKCEHDVPASFHPRLKVKGVKARGKQ